MKDKNIQTKSGWSNEIIPYIEQYEGNLPMSQIILGIIGMVGIVSIAVLAPNALRILRFIEPHKWEKKNKTYRINEVVRRFIKEKIVIVEQEGDKEPCVRLTQKGTQRFHQFQIKIGRNRKEEWDGKWRVIIFDVLEKRRKIRDHLRVELKNMGFRKLQGSVWVYPYECEDLIALLKIDLKLGRDVLYFITEKMEDDEYLKRMFALPKK